MWMKNKKGSCYDNSLFVRKYELCVFDERQIRVYNTTVR